METSVEEEVGGAYVGECQGDWPDFVTEGAMESVVVCCNQGVGRVAGIGVCLL